MKCWKIIIDKEDGVTGSISKFFMISNQDWHTNHQGEGYTTVRDRLRVICRFPDGYDNKELAMAVAALPQLLSDYRELIAIVEKVNPDRAKKSKQLLRKARQ